MELNEIKASLDERDRAVLDKLAKSDERFGEVLARIGEIEQRAVRQGGGDWGRSHRSWGEELTRSEQFRTFIANKCTGTQRLEVKTITTGSGSGGALIPPDRQADVAMLPKRQLRVRDLITPGQTVSGTIQYIRQTTRTNAAAMVAEADLKPESAYAWELVDAPVRTLAHWVPASRQAFDDAPQIASIVDGELRFGLDDVEDNQLLNGGGTGQDLNGVYTQATAYAAPIVPSEATITKIDVLRLAILQVHLARYPATGIVLSPQDWADIEMTKSVEGDYILGTPRNSPGQTLWGLPVVDTTAMTLDKFLVGAFGTPAAQIFDRMDTEVVISSEDRDNFIRNLLTVRAEKRLALVVRRPAAFIKGGFTEALAA